MRIKFNNHIDLCKRVSCPKDGRILIITTLYNEVYTVDMVTSEDAEEAYNEILANGYYDVSEYEYSN